MAFLRGKMALDYDSAINLLRTCSRILNSHFFTLL